MNPTIERTNASRRHPAGGTATDVTAGDSGATPLFVSDIDGVAYPYVAMLHSIAVAHDMPGAAEAAEHPRSYDMGPWMPQDTLRDAHLVMMSGPEMHRPHDDLPGGGGAAVNVYAELLAAVQQAGARIVFATRRAHYTADIGGSFDSAADLTRSWLAERYPFPHQVEFVDRKTDLDLLSDCVLLIDDNPREVRAVAEAGCCAWLMDQPYNRRRRDRRGLSRFRLDRLGDRSRLMLALAPAGPGR